jgi:hypothetical protein
VPESETARPPFFYWVLAAGLILMGALGATGIGLVLLPIGLGMLFLGLRGNGRYRFWPPIIGLLAYVASFILLGYLVGPLSCNTHVNVTVGTASGESESRVIADNSATTCSSPLLTNRSRGYGPPFWPVILASAAIGFGVASLSRLVRRGRKAGMPAPPQEIATSRQKASPFYWLATIAVFLFGFLAIFSIGVPLLVLGLALIVLSPYRGRPAIFWPPLVVVVLFFVAFILVAPLYCSQTFGPQFPGDTNSGPIGQETCSRILLPDTSGPDPSVWPSILIAAVAGTAGGVVARLVLNKHGREARTIDQGPPAAL